MEAPSILEDTLAKILLDKIKEEQAKRNESDVAFARFIGVNRSLWQRVANGGKSRARLGPAIIFPALAKFPDLKDSAMAYMLVYREKRYKHKLHSHSTDAASHKSKVSMHKEQVEALVDD